MTWLAIRALLGRIPLWVWPVLVLVAWGAKGNLEASHLHKVVKARDAQTELANELAVETARLQILQATHLKENRDAEDKRTAARLVDLEQRLRTRPDRLPAAATAACEGGTGAGLSRPDGEFLAGLAARANQLRAALAECQGWVETVKRRQP